MNHDKSSRRGHSVALSSVPKDHYQILNITASATAKEIREAYFRLKNTYNNSNQALYSLVGGEDLNETLADIEEAYNVLGNDRLRAHYDEARLAPHGESPALETPPKGRPEKTSEAKAPPPPRSEEAKPAVDSRPGATAAEGNAVSFAPVAEMATTLGLANLPPSKMRRAMAANAHELEIRQKVAEAIADGDPADGNLYKKLRLIVGIDKEELQEHIKISIGYIDHLEQNRFDLLPQPVYVKGFLKSYLRYLGVSDCEPLVKAYAEKFTIWFESKHSS